MNKIFSKKEITTKINLLKKNNKKIVLCHGVFDLVHYGHILYLQSAKKFGDFLIVSVTRDEFIKKGTGKPIFNLDQLMKYLSSLSLVDAVVASTVASSEDVIKSVKPNFYVKGPDYKKVSDDKTKKIILEKKLVESFGGKIKFTDDISFSSSSLINSSNLLFNEEQKKFISDIKKKFGYNYILSEVSKFKKIKVLVLGELIFDNYIFGNIVGKSGKEPHLVFETGKSEYYVGGSGAICRHLQEFVRKVDYLSNFGNEPHLAKYLKINFSKNVSFKNLKPSSNFTSIIKLRYLDIKSNYKMFGAYSLPKKIDQNYEIKYYNFLSKLIAKNDLIVAVDYGHGLIPENTMNKISSKNKFISAGKQINSSSIISHNMLNHNKLNLISINETELRYSEKNNKEKIETLILNLYKRIKPKTIIVTRGKNGSILYSGSKFYYCPAFAVNPIDKIGAGDAMLSITSLCDYKGLHPSITLMLGSLAASNSVQSIGNKFNTSKSQLKNNLEYILK